MFYVLGFAIFIPIIRAFRIGVRGQDELVG